MRVNFSKRPNFGAIGRRYKREVKARMAEDLGKMILSATDVIIERTPVYTGKTLRNFRWGLDTPPVGVLAAITKGGLPGKTSSAPLGSEVRRDDNAAEVKRAALETIEDIKRNPFREIFLVNNHDNFFRVEYGTYSEKARTPPGGIARAAEIKIKLVLEGMK